MLLLAAGLGGCAASRLASRLAATSVAPQSDWSEAIVYFVITDRWAHPALSLAVHEKLVAEGDLPVFLQKDPKCDEAVVVAVNRGDAPVVARLPAPEAWGIGPIRDEWNGVAVPLTSGTVETTLEGKAARILAREALH